MSGSLPGDSADPEVRRRALGELSDSGDPSRASELVAALGDEDWRVRKEAARVAVGLALRWGLLPSLVDALVQGDNVGLRNAALEVLERLGPAASDVLLTRLPTVPDGARKFLVAALGYAGRAGVDRLASLSTDPDFNTAQAALEALARIGGARAEAALRGHLASDDPVQRVAALEGLERLEAAVGLEELRPLLDDRFTRRLALRLLGFCEDVEAVPVLTDVLREIRRDARGEGVSAMAVEATVAMGRLLRRGGAAGRALRDRVPALPRESLTALHRVCDSGGDSPRRAATWILLLARDPEILGGAAELAADDRLSEAVLDAIRAFGDEAVRPLLAEVGRLEPRAAATALEMAAELATGETDAVTIDALRAALRAAAGSEEAVMVAAGVAGLARWGRAQDASLIVESATTVVGTEQAAGLALTSLARREPAAVHAALSQVALEGALGAAVVPAVAALEGGAERVQEMLNAEDPRARCAAVAVLPLLGEERAAELAGFALADEDVEVQTAAVRVLARLETGSAQGTRLEGLRLALRASSEQVVAAAAEALGALGDRGAIPALRELVDEGRPGAAVAAMQALRRLEDPGLDELLSRALEQPDEELVKEALRAIGRGVPKSGVRVQRIALALDHTAWDVRQLAARLLGEAPSEAACEAMQARKDRESDPLVLAALEDALRRCAAERA